MTVPQHIRRALAIGLALLLVACGGGPAALPSPTPEAPAGPRPRTRLVLWHAWSAADQRALNALIERYNRASAEVQVVPQTRPVTSLTSDLATAVAEGGGPHLAIVQSHTLGALAESGWIQPIDDLVPAGDLERLLPAAVGAARVAGAGASPLYGAPISFDTLALYYNRANFAQAPPDDTAALLDLARGLSDTRASPPRWGLTYNLSLDRTVGYLYAFGGRVFDEQGNLVLGLDGRAGAEAWLRWLVALRRDEALLASADGIAVDSAMLSGGALMTIDWSNALAEYRSLWPETLGVAPLPRLTDEDRPPSPYVQSDVLALNARISDPAERAAAASFISFLLGADSQAELLRAGRQPTLLSVDLDDQAVADADLRAAAQAFRLQGQRGQPMPNSRLAQEVVWAALADMQSSVLRGLLTPEQAVADTDTALRARLGLPAGVYP